MRKYRNLLVQSLDQYKYVYYCMRDAIEQRIKV
jgi:protein tyrosine phosphatase